MKTTTHKSINEAIVVDSANIARAEELAVKRGKASVKVTVDGDKVTADVIEEKFYSPK